MPTRLLRDPRHYQIAVLCSLLVVGRLLLDLPVSLPLAVLVAGTALLTQLVCVRAMGAPSFDWRSPLISSLSLCLLLRSSAVLLYALAAVLAISSKFLLRHRGKHLFNPTAFAIVVLMASTDRAWVSPGQWGSTALLGLFLAGLGSLVIHRAERSDVTYAFLLFYGVLVFGRAWWLGDPWSIPWHHLQSGALLIFAFFMLSDPKTTPDSRPGRLLFAALVAAGTGFVHFVLYRPHGPLWALVACALLVPLIDRWLVGRRYHWSRRGSTTRGETADAAPTHTLPVPDPAASGLPA